MTKKLEIRNVEKTAKLENTAILKIAFFSVFAITMIIFNLYCFMI